MYFRCPPLSTECLLEGTVQENERLSSWCLRAVSHTLYRGCTDEVSMFLPEEELYSHPGLEMAGKESRIYNLAGKIPNCMLKMTQES